MYKPVQLGKEPGLGLDYIMLIVSLQVNLIFIQLIRAGEGH